MTALTYFRKSASGTRRVPRPRLEVLTCHVVSEDGRGRGGTLNENLCQPGWRDPVSRRLRRAAARDAWSGPQKLVQVKDK